MGKTSKPLNILVVGFDKSQYFADLALQGHTIHYDIPGNSTPCDEGEGLREYDLILGHKCWRMNKKLLKYLPLAIKESRKTAYPTTKKKEEAEDDGTIRTPDGE